MISAVLASNAARRRARNIARGAPAHEHATTFRDAPLDWTFATAPPRADDAKAIGAAGREQSTDEGNGWKTTTRCGFLPAVARGPHCGSAEATAAAHGTTMAANGNRMRPKP